jgi:hydrogenase expression/formation protein HypE
MPRDPAAKQIVLAHGGGGELTHRLIAEHILPRLGNDLLDPLTDGAVWQVEAGRLAFTTDGHVIQPLEFPGGDIGRLAVCGTVNDIAVMGAEPQFLSLALVIEEGLSLETLDRILDSVAAAAREAGVQIATGDTKVIERQRGDGLLINTTGIGRLRDGVRLSPKRIQPNDVIIINGRIAEHGLAVMSAREGLAFETNLRSDVAPVGDLIGRMFESGADIKFLRDPTRGGLAELLADISEEADLSVELVEKNIPLSAVARHTAELLGLDPITVANEGKVVAVVSEADAEKVLDACRAHPLGKDAAVIGRFSDEQPAVVELLTPTGGRRIVQRPYGEELPRIC